MVITLKHMDVLGSFHIRFSVNKNPVGISTIQTWWGPEKVHVLRRLLSISSTKVSLFVSVSI